MKTYQAKYNPLTNKGVYGISLVENPAMEGLFIALSKDEKIQFKTVDAEKRIIVGLVLEPNKPIYRNQNGEEFNIVFSDQTVEELCYGFTKNQNNSNSTIEHDIEQKIVGLTFVENWIVRDEKMDTSLTFGLNPKKGSWMSIAKVDSDEIWNDYTKTEKVKGFSIDAMLSLEEVNLKTNINMSEQAKTNSLLEKILLAFNPAKTEIKLGEVMLMDGSVKIEFEGDVLEAGKSCWVTAEDGTKVPVPVGEHPLEDGTILVVVTEGIVEEIKPASEPEGEPAPAQDLGNEDGKVSNDAKIASEIESAIKSILIKYSEQSKQIETLQTQITELSKQPASKPINGTPVQVDFSKMSAKERIFNTINKNKN